MGNAQPKYNQANSVELIAAVKGKKDADVLRLLEAGANPNSVDPETKLNALGTVLTLAEKEGEWIDIFAMLAIAGADPSKALDNDQQDPPLVLAARLGRYALAKILVRAGANLEAENKMGKTPLIEATHEGWTGIAEHLLSSGAALEKKNKFQHNALTTAITRQNEDAVKLFIEKKANLEVTDKDGFSALFLGIETCNYNIVEMLINAGADIHALGKENNETSVAYAVKQGNARVVRLLIARGARYNVADRFRDTPLIHAAAEGRPDVLDVLLEQPDIEIAAVNEYRDNCITHASNKNTPDAVVKLARRGANMNNVNDMGQTGLIAAASRGFKEVCRALLSCGANPDIVVKGTNQTALVLAAYRDDDASIEIVKMLVRAGADLDITAEGGNSFRKRLGENEKLRKAVLEELVWRGRVDIIKGLTLPEEVIKADTSNILHVARRRRAVAISKLCTISDADAAAAGGGGGGGERK